MSKVRWTNDRRLRIDYPKIIDGEELPEIGYHIEKTVKDKGMQRKRSAVLEWALEHTEYPAFYSYCGYTNIPSLRRQKQ